MVDACQTCSGASGTPGNGNIIRGITICDHCSSLIHQFQAELQGNDNSFLNMLDVEPDSSSVIQTFYGLVLENQST
mgnify:CR=1 FL=1|tara:strand:- start:298 stop:525 length:228 start_codon:yes stop_codon:yes gene_type:complete